MPDVPASPGWWDDVRLACGFFTRLPIRAADGGRPLGSAARAFPISGVLVGLLGAIALECGLAVGLSSGLAALISVAVLLLVTGALHEDGLADVADGFGGGRDRASKLEIMRDSRIGSYGVVVLMLVLAFRLVAVTELAVLGFGAGALVAAGALSRGLLPAIMHRLPRARPDGLAAHAGGASPSGALVSAALGLGIALLLGAASGRTEAAIAAALAAAAAVAALAALARAQIGGYTGDVLGAAQQVAEAAFLVTLTAVL